MNKNSKTTAFTLTEGATHVETCDSSNKTAFTLAEVMIVVAIIGVVAAIIMPGFIQDMSERINSNRQANIAQKITKSVELMIVNGEYTGITTTEQFVDKLTKYLKIAKRCDNEHLRECWPTDTIKTAKGETYNISDAKTSSALHTKGNTNTVGLILVDGAALILAYNPNAAGINAESNFVPYKKALPIGNGKTEEFAYSSNATGAIDFVMDVNGKTGPNQEPDFDGRYFDIRSFRMAAFSVGECSGGVKVNGGQMCLVDLGKDYQSINCLDSENSEYCPAGYGNVFVDYWGGANKVCKERGMRLPTYAEIRGLPSGLGFQCRWLDYTPFDVNPNQTGYGGVGGGTMYRTAQYCVFCVGE